MATHMTFGAIGTRWQITIPTAVADEAALEQKIRARIDTYDKDYSRFRDDSFVRHIAIGLGTYRMPDDADLLFDLYDRLYRLTDGLMTPLVATLMEDAGYDPSYSLTPKENIRDIPAWDEVMRYQDGTLETFAPVLLDVGAAGKGYLIDIVGRLLKSEGANSYTIDAGGDILQKGSELRVGLEDPHNPENAIGIVTIDNESICASATTRRRWNTFHHVMNPKTRASTEGITAVWVIAQSALVADGLATALFFVTPEVLQKEFSFAYTIVYDDRSVKQSANFGGELFTA